MQASRSRVFVTLIVAAACLSFAACAPAPPPAVLPPMPASLRVPDIAYGVSTAAYQNEDPACEPLAANCFRTDWDLAFEAGKIPHAKGDAAYAFSETQRDIDALIWLGATHYRFGIEWARVEPRPGEFNQAAIDHYADFARRLREAGIEPVPCLWHWTFPDWLTDLDRPERHGWLHPDAATHWVEYVSRLAVALAPHCNLFAPMNEPNIQSLAGFVVGDFPPFAEWRFDLNDANRAATIDGFLVAVQILRTIHATHAAPAAPAARIISIDIRTAWHQSPLDPLGLFVNFLREGSYAHLDGVVHEVDIVGFTYYGRQQATVEGAASREPGESSGYSDLGIEIYPQGLTEALAEMFARYGKPMAIMENGIADDRDDRRPVYLATHLAAVQEAIEQGYPVFGYFFWSLCDNYEWMDGYRPKFGLFGFEPASRGLTPKASADLYRRLIEARGGEFVP